MASVIVVKLIRYTLDMLPSRELHAGERKRMEAPIARNLASWQVELHVDTEGGLSFEFVPLRGHRC